MSWSGSGTLHDILGGGGGRRKGEKERGEGMERGRERRGGDKIGREAGWVLIMICFDVPQPGVYSPTLTSANQNLDHLRGCGLFELALFMQLC